MTVSQTGTTTFGGSIQDSASQISLMLTSGKLVLSGTNTYSGGTYVTGGTLATALGDNEAIEDGTNLYVGTDVLSAFGSVLPRREHAASGAEADHPLSVGKFQIAADAGLMRSRIQALMAVDRHACDAPVPEPGTLALLIAGVAVTAAISGRRRRGR